MMRSTFVLFAVLSTLTAVRAEDVAKPSVGYSDALKACGAEWKGFKKEHANTGGREQWNMFRADCVSRQGYVSGKGAAKRISNEDFAKLLGK